MINYDKKKEEALVILFKNMLDDAQSKIDSHEYEMAKRRIKDCNWFLTHKIFWSKDIGQLYVDLFEDRVLMIGIDPALY